MIIAYSPLDYLDLEINYVFKYLWWKSWYKKFNNRNIILDIEYSLYITYIVLYELYINILLYKKNEVSEEEVYVAVYFIMYIIVMIPFSHKPLTIRGILQSNSAVLAVCQVVADVREQLRGISRDSSTDITQLQGRLRQLCGDIQSTLLPAAGVILEEQGTGGGKVQVQGKDLGEVGVKKWRGRRLKTRR